MTPSQVLLGTIVLTTGLFTGLLMTVLFFFQRVLKDLSGLEFALVMRRFLKITRTHPLNYGMVLTSGLAPVAVLVLLRGEPGGPAFLLTAAGLLVFWCGPILFSRFGAERVYDVFVGWEAAPPDGWREARDRYFRLNVVRFVGSTAAFACFVAALGLAAS